MKHYPYYPERSVLSLEGLWDFSFIGEDLEIDNLSERQIHYDDFMDVPMAFDATPAYAGKQGLAAYRKFITLAEGRKHYLKVAGMGMQNRFYIDQEEIGLCRLPYTGMTIPIPEKFNGEVELVVLSDNRLDINKTPLFDKRTDFYSYGGFFRGIDLHSTGPLALDRVQIKTENITKPQISARIFFQEEVQNTEIEKICFKVCIREYNSSGKRGHTLLEIENPNFSSQTNMEFSFVLPDARIWTLDDPALYELIVRVDDGKHSDTVIERFGIRIVGTDKGQITLNGQPVKLLGYNRHESHPQFGPALPYSQLVQDLQILKDLNCNFIRGSHYPQDQRFLDLCDESGFLFFEESFSWQHNDRHFSRPDFMEDMELQNRLMVRNSYNHPSVIMWGFLNEGDSHKESSRQAYESCFRAIREEDRTRLITYATNHPLDDLYLELCDVISINTYPGWYEMDDEDPAEEVTRPLDRINQEINLLIEHKNSSNHKNKPLILSEIGAGAIYGWRDSLRSHWTEGYQEDYLETVCTRICEDDALAGVALWQFCDGRTYQSGRAVKRPRAFNNKGTCDEYRRPKIAYTAVQRIFGAYRERSCLGTEF